MAEQKKRVAIIGAGASGITAIKSCLDEQLDPVCFERTDNIGGLWRYTDTPIDGQGCVMKSTVINTSKEMMSYSDFPIPAEYPIFMHNTQVYEYFKLYVKKFDLEGYIKFHTEVVSVKQSDDFAQTGQWKIQTKDLETNEEKTEVFDGVLVCTGHHADKYEPEFPGLSSFKGKVIHTHDYRHPGGMEDKRVLIVGIGNSGGDVAVELSRWASQVYISTRRGTWILNRVAERGYPLDMVMSRRFTGALLKYVPSNIMNMLVSYRLNQRIDHDLYSLRPDYGPLSQHPMVNDDMPNRIVCGAIKIKGDIKTFTETGVEFIDGTKEDNIDVVFKATGYSFGFPFIDKSVIDVKENRVQLYKYIYPPDLEHKTLAVIGCLQPLGAIMPISELQCRLATRVIKGVTSLPSKGNMWADVRNKEAAMAKRFVKSRRHTIQVDYISFMDEIAELIGCKPDIRSLFTSDPYLGLQVLIGPATPYQFRLHGPGQWPEARKAIMTQWERTEEPLKTRQLSVAKDGKDKGWLMKFGTFVVIICIIRFLFFM